MKLLASDTGDCLKGVIVPAIVFGVRLHIPAGTRAAKNKSGHPILITLRTSGPFDLKQFTAESMYYSNAPRMMRRQTGDVQNFNDASLKGEEGKARTTRRSAQMLVRKILTTMLRLFQ